MFSQPKKAHARAFSNFLNWRFQFWRFVSSSVQFFFQFSPASRVRSYRRPAAHWNWTLETENSRLWGPAWCPAVELKTCKRRKAVSSATANPPTREPKKLAKTELQRQVPKKYETKRNDTKRKNWKSTENWTEELRASRNRLVPAVCPMLSTPLWPSANPACNPCLLPPTLAPGLGPPLYGGWVVGWLARWWVGWLDGQKGNGCHSIRAYSETRAAFKYSVLWHLIFFLNFFLKRGSEKNLRGF